MFETNLKLIVKNLLKSYNLRLSRFSAFERENSFEAQARLLAKNTSPLTIFDVGAYEGKIALRYNNLFPNSNIFCFEPFPASFNKLSTNTASYENIRIFEKGLGSYNEPAKFYVNNTASTNSLLATHEKGSTVWGTGVLETKKMINVTMITLDHFIKQNNIKQIDILKLDVQGAEYMVLEGAETALKQNKIKMIYTEIITLPTYKEQKSLGENIHFFMNCGFELFNFYNYDLTNNGQLRQVDALFIRKK